MRGRIISILRKVFKWLGFLLLGLLLLFIILVLVIRTPWAQQKIVNEVTAFVSQKVDTRFEIQRAFLTFTGNVQVEGVYMEDQQQDTLVYIGALEAGVSVMPLINGNINISRIDWDGLVANVSRDKDSIFNFQYLIDAFAGEAKPDTATADTSSQLPHIGIGPVDFANFRVHYRDEVMGMDAKLNLGQLKLRTRDIDLNTMEIKLKSIAISNVTADVEQWLETPPSEEDTSSSPMPYITFNDIELENIDIKFKSTPLDIETALKLGNFNITDTKVDLAKQDISIEEVALKNTNIFAQLPEPAPVDTTQIDTTPTAPFVWPDWKVKLDKLELANNNVELKMGQPAATPGQFNPNDMRIEGLTLQAKDLELGERKASLKMQEFAFKDKSGFELNQLAFNLQLDDSGVTIDGLQLNTPNNTLKSNINVNYAAIDSLMQNPTGVGFDLKFEEAHLSITDAFFFSPELKQDTFVQSISAYPLVLTGGVSGRMDDIHISDLQVSWLNSLELALDGRIEGLPDTNAIAVDIPHLELHLTKKDLMVFVAEADSLTLPNQMHLQANLQGNMKDLKTDLALKTDMGSVTLAAKLQDIMGTPAGKGNLKLTGINVAQLASVPDLEPVSLTLDFDGKGKDLESLALDARLNFQKLIYQGYDYSKLSVDLNAFDQKANAVLSHKDENLDFLMKLSAKLDTLNPAADIILDLDGIDLLALGFSEENIKLGANLSATYKGKGKAFDTQLKVDKGIIVKANETYRLQPLNAKLKNDVNKTELDVSSDIVNGSLRANTSIDSVVGALTAYFNRLTSTDSLRAGIMNDTLDVTAHFTINNSLVLTEVALPELTQMDTVQLDLEFHPSRDQLSLYLNAPKIVYADYTLDSLGINATADEANMRGALVFRQLRGGPIDIHRTSVDFGYQDKMAQARLSVRDSVDGQLAAIGVDMDLRTDSVTLLHIATDKLLLNSEAWNIPASNQISITNAGAIYKMVELRQGSQLVKVENVVANNPNGMKVSFSGFELSSFTTILHTADSLLSGTLNGTLQLTDLGTEPGIEADISLNKLTLMGNNLGVLSLDAHNRTKDRYDINLTLKGNSIDMETKGSFLSAEQPSLDLDVDLKRVDMKLIEGFADGQLQNSSGMITGACQVNGPTSDIKYDGYLAFDKASFNVSMVNTQFTLSKDKIEVSNDGLVFNKFSLIDANGRKTTLDGTVNTQDMLNPTYDLRLVSSNFQLLNSTREDNDLFYGKAFIDTDVKISGTMNQPKVNAKAKLRKGSDITFIVPESQAEIEERKGLVTFANMKDTLSMVLQHDEPTETQGIIGLDLIGYFEIDPETQFQIVIDERSGDKILIAGEAKLNLEMTPNGLMTLSGTYEVGSGSYDMNFYGLAKRKFELRKGSRIVWSGDPLEGEMDLTAEYNIKTSATDLMADQITESNATKYRQELPFEVQLNIDGPLLKPEISFGLDMPEDARQAMDGNVYKRIRQLNQSESELNKQVFSLIVLNRFLPQGGGDDNTGASTENIARSSVSKMLSGQLNAYSAKYLKGVELNFDLNSYTDYQSGTAENKTDLDISLRKALFNERLVFQVGSQVGIEGSNRSYDASDVIGDVSLEYLLTKEGQYRLKAFRKNQYQDLVEGQLVVTGLSVLFSRDYDEFKDLFKRTPKKEEEPQIETEEQEEKQ